MRRRCSSRRRMVKEMMAPTPYGVNYHRNFQIAPAAKVVFDQGERAHDEWLIKREQEQAAREQKSYMIGTLDLLEQNLIQLYQKVMEIQNTIVEYMNFPMLTVKQKKAIRRIKMDMDKVNMLLTNNLLANLDKLGTADQAKLINNDIDEDRVINNEESLRNEKR